jgi:exonuclease III
MLIISLNIRQGGGRRADSILAWIEAHAPDVVALLEWRNNPIGKDIKRRLEGSGLSIAIGAAHTARSNGLLIAARTTFNPLRVTPKESDKGELLLVSFAHLRLLAAYFPQKAAKSPFFQACRAEALKSHQMPFLLLGDLNTGRNDLDIEGNGARFHCADLFEALEYQSDLLTYGAPNTAPNASGRGDLDAMVFGSTTRSGTSNLWIDMHRSAALTIIRLAKLVSLITVQTVSVITAH